MVHVVFSHNDQLVGDLELHYAGRANIFEGHWVVPEVQKDYEVVRVRVTASQPEVTNFGVHERTFKLIP